MKALPLVGAVILCLSQPLSADPAPGKAADLRAQKSEERLVFVTGSFIPQRIKVQSLGTATVSPVRIINRHEIDGTGRVTTPGAFANEPSVRIVGH